MSKLPYTALGTPAKGPPAPSGPALGYPPAWQSCGYAVEHDANETESTRCQWMTLSLTMAAAATVCLT